MMMVFVFGLPSVFPVAVTGWFAGQWLALHFIPVAVAAWALWVIVWSQRAPSMESAGAHNMPTPHASRPAPCRLGACGGGCFAAAL